MKKRYIITIGFALFAMFFGAGNLIFPPTLGKLAGSDFIFSAMGFLLTGVGLPFLGILAVAKAGGGIEFFAARVNKRFAKFLSIIIVLAIGPLLAIPRTCATTFELAIIPNLPGLNSWLFSFIYFAVVLFFALNPSSVVDRIGKYLTPALLLGLSALIIKGIFWPIDTPINTFTENAFGLAFVEGYQTMDLLAASIFGLIILNDVRSKGVQTKKKQLSVVIKAGMISVTGLALVYTGLMYLGATTSSWAADISRTELLLKLASNLLGWEGMLALGVAVAMACLTTAIGLTVVCAEYFEKYSKGKLSYRLVCFLVAGVSLIFSNAGVEKIVEIAVVPLVALYPIVMCLIILTLLGNKIKRRRIWQGAVLGAFAAGCFDSMHRLGIYLPIIDNVYNYLPFSSSGLAWILPAAFFAFFGSINFGKKGVVFQIS